jgi:hypothetical protein
VIACAWGWLQGRRERSSGARLLPLLLLCSLLWAQGLRGCKMGLGNWPKGPKNARLQIPRFRRPRWFSSAREKRRGSAVSE